ncbi:hypothetical protein [Flyfo microvirus Tbat2_43]|nr:hypothetical protein [Flyfo microvirus Tbat2_43]
MTLKGMIDRKLFKLIVEPILRRLGTVLAVYLASKGVPEDAVHQLLAALGVVLGLAFDIALAAVDKRKAENAGARRILDTLGKVSTDDAFYEPLR